MRRAGIVSSHVTGAVASSYVDPDVFFALLSQVAAPEGQSGNVVGSSAQKMTPIEKTGKAHAYSIDGVTWLSVRARRRGGEGLHDHGRGPGWR